MINQKIVSSLQGDKYNMWLVVREVDVQKLGLNKNDFTHYSRTTVHPRYGSVFALDQDVDFKKFTDACKQHNVELYISQPEKADNLHQIRDWSSIELIQDHAQNLRAL
ncbi:MAG: hypothetical protein CL942_15740 [Desulfovibrio sp.]|nr:hypothetical protein [Desulfovibrio sp.]|tara:strand:- start:121 stop:444 length:324 start_codon:yes stop_codon:yes gene_type:complete